MISYLPDAVKRNISRKREQPGQNETATDRRFSPTHDSVIGILRSEVTFNWILNNDCHVFISQ